jgi:hypothetical protein
LRDLLELTLEGARGALRLRVEGRSTARGTPPQWVAAASDFQVIGLSQGSAVVELEAEPIADAAPDRFGAEDPSLPLDTSRSALSFFEESFAEALRGKEDADLYDRALLGTFTNFSRLFAQGLERIEFTNRNEPVPLQIDVLPDRLKEVEKLWKKTAPSQRVRVAGRLDTIRHSDRMFTLVLESGETLRGIAELGPDDLAQYFGQSVVVSGKAMFRPSGSILRIEADNLEPAAGNVAIWSRVPRPLLGELDRRSLKPQGSRSGINAIIGRWPGDETEGEILEALEEIS